jgi:hypothetical protein
MKRPKPKPAMSFVELQARVTALEASDRSDANIQARANRLLHEQFSNELAQGKRAHGQRMADAIRQASYKG